MNNQLDFRHKYQAWVSGKSRNQQPTLKILVKVKDEIELFSNWYRHHSDIVGPENIIIFNCKSESQAFKDLLQSLTDKSFVFDFSGYYDHLHQYNIVHDIYDTLIDECDYITLLDADEFIFEYSDGQISTANIVRTIAGWRGSCLAATWFNNVSLPAYVGEIVDFTRPINFSASLKSIKAGSYSAKIIIEAKKIPQARYVGHSFGDSRLEKFVGSESFGRIGLFHINYLPTFLVKKRSLNHLRSKKILLEGEVEEESMIAKLKSLVEEKKLNGVDKLYAERFINPLNRVELPEPHFESFLLSGKVESESIKELNAWRDFDYLSFVEGRKKDRAEAAHRPSSG